MPNDNSSTITNNGTTGYPTDNPSTAQNPALDLASSKETRSTTNDTRSFPPLSSETTLSEPSSGIYSEVASRISEAKNVLIALSSDPSVDEMAAAIGLSLYLDKLGKRATAIYSGTTPNALKFLKPEQTFEPTADTLQDFVIALSKEKADHLRYKLDGSYVKIYVTPYRSRISEEDLEFSYGDYNVDLVLALDVVNGIDLDSALREHGRIMHDAVIVNITTSNPGKFGEIEWSDKKASSISEMIAKLLYSVNSEVEIGKEEATAFLTGIVAATNRFSNANTTPETMRISSLLMDSGANQQLVSRNITPDLDNESIDINKKYKDDKRNVSLDKKRKDDRRDTDLNINHNDSLDYDREPIVSQAESRKPFGDGDKGLLDDLKAAAENLSHAGAETSSEIAEEPFRINGDKAEPPVNTEEKLRTPPVVEEKNSSVLPEPVVLPKPFIDKQLDNQSTNPAATNVPNVPVNPDINDIPEMNYMPMPDDSILPPPPTPPIGVAPQDMPPSDLLNRPATPEVAKEPFMPSDLAGTTTSASLSADNVTMGSLPSVSVNSNTAGTPTEANPNPLGGQPAMQDQVYVPPASDPSAFKIPGV